MFDSCFILLFQCAVFLILIASCLDVYTPCHLYFLDLSLFTNFFIFQFLMAISQFVRFVEKQFCFNLFGKHIKASETSKATLLQKTPSFILNELLLLLLLLSESD